MFFSVLIPVYNVEKYLRQAVDSVLAQDFDDYEIILCDDGSTDQSGAICDEYAQKDSKIRVIHKENEGLILTRRAAIRASEGEYLMHLDSDDYMLPGCLSSVKKAIDDTGADMVIWKMIYGKKNQSDKEVISPIPFKDGEIFEGEKLSLLRKEFLNKGKLQNMYIKATRRDINNIDFDYSQYKIYKAEDIFQSLHLFDATTKAVFIDKVFYYYRRDNMTSISNKLNKDTLKKHLSSYFLLWQWEEDYIKKWFEGSEMQSDLSTRALKAITTKAKQMGTVTKRDEFKDFLNWVMSNDKINFYFDNYNKNSVGPYAKFLFWLIKNKKYNILYNVVKIIRL
ncbi:MAG: glycosyltransferase family 2 protein [Abditibacteriota bacterium]|nr:glycosyltransferase family 2 protein [Abditibacteriota bacterium]